jgi:hypothetical protein
MYVVFLEFKINSWRLADSWARFLDLFKNKSTYMGNYSMTCKALQMSSYSFLSTRV